MISTGPGMTVPTVVSGADTGTLGVCIGGLFGFIGANVRMMPSGLIGAREGLIVGYFTGREVE